MLKRVLLPAIGICLIGAITIVGQEREKLTSPVYHVDKGADAVPMERGPAPVLENVAAPTQPEQVDPNPDSVRNQPIPADGAPVAEVASSIPPTTQNVATSIEVPAAPAISEARKKLNEAVADARDNLAHIQENVHDYTCTFIKQENVKGKVLPKEYISLKIRSERVENGEVVVPFSAYFKFMRPKEVKNREVLYVAGRYPGTKLLAKEARGPNDCFPRWSLELTAHL